MKRLSLLLLASLATTVVFATTYVRVEADGTKTYSDRPIPGGQPVEVQPAQTYSTPSSPVTSTQSNLPSEQRELRGIDDFQYTSCAISPANDETFTNPESVSVQVILAPTLRAGDKVNLVVDGTPANPEALSISLQQLSRGAHTATATLKDRYGRTLCSASSTFHVFRPSVNMPKRR